MAINRGYPLVFPWFSQVASHNHAMAAMIQAPKLALEIFENVRDDPGLGADGMSHLVPQWLDGFQWKILFVFKWMI